MFTVVKSLNTIVLIGFMFTVVKSLNTIVLIEFMFTVVKSLNTIVLIEFMFTVVKRKCLKIPKGDNPKDRQYNDKRKKQRSTKHYTEKCCIPISF
jgi:hypothetical protein